MQSAPTRRERLAPDAEAPRYMRNASALSVEETRALLGKCVLVAGCGGLGGYVIECLARIGVGTIIAVDDDAFDETNLNRQLLACEKTLGEDKAEAARERIAQVNPDVRLIAKCATIDQTTADDLVADVDCVIDALDDPRVRFLLAHAAVEAGKPIVYGAVAGWYGQVCTVLPGDVSFPVVYGTPKGESAHIAEGVLAPTVACTAAHQAAEAVKVLLGKEGLIRNRLLMIDMLFGSCDDMDITG